MKQLVMPRTLCKCVHCDYQLLHDSYKFCPQCGRLVSLVESKIPENSQPLPSFEDYLKRKSDDRQGPSRSANKKQKKSKKVEEVLLNVGLMYLCGNMLKPVRGKTLPVRALPSVNKVELLGKCVDKHAAHDRSFAPCQGHTLVYPDGTEVVTIPGKPTESFTLERYKNEIGKPYNRITLYLALRSDVLSIDVSDSDDAVVVKEIPPKTKRIECSTAVRPTDANQRTLCEMSSTCTSKSCVQGSPTRVSPLQKNSAQEHPAEEYPRAGYESQTSSQQTPSPLQLNNLKEIFPQKNTSVLERAMECTNSLEDAVNYVLRYSDAPAYDLYSALSTEHFLPDESLSVDQLDECPDDFTVEAHDGVLHYAKDENLKNLLSQWGSSHLNSGEQIRMKVRRQFVWQDILLKLDRIEEGGHNKQLRVQFVGEPSVDRGGPSRELFSLVNQHVGTSLLANGVFRHNVTALQSKEFFRFGQLTALGLLQGSPGPKFFSPSVTNYILYGKMEKCTPTIEEIPCEEVKGVLKSLQDVTDEEEFKEKASFQCSFRFESGYSKPFVTLSDKDEFLRCIALHHVILMSLSELEQFIEGLKNCEILQLIRSNAEAFRMVFEYSNQLTADLVDEIFVPIYSPVGSSAFVKEQAIMFNFNQLLEDIEQGKVNVVVEGQNVKMALGDILQFVTGSSDIPAIGFIPQPSILFLHGDDAKQKLSANTCSNILRLTVTDELCKYDNFKEDVIFCIMNSPGFGNI